MEQDWGGFWSRIRDRHYRIYRVALLILTTAIIVSLFPTEISFRYEFQQNKPWLHDDLIAPFDFDVVLSPEELKEEKEARIKDFNLYYEWNAQNKTSFFTEKINSFADSLFSDRFIQVNQAIALYHNILDRGLISIAEGDENKEGSQQIVLIRDNLASTANISDFFTYRSAIQLVQENFPETPLREKITELYSQSLVYNVEFSEQKTRIAREEQLSAVASFLESVEKGALVVGKGELIDLNINRRLHSLKNAYTSRLLSSNSIWLIRLGQSILVVLCLSALLVFLRMFLPKLLRSPSGQMFLFFLVLMDVLVTKLVLSIDGLHIYLVPLCLVPLIVRSFFDTRLALFTHIIGVLVVSFMVPNPYEFVFLQIIAGSLLLFGTEDLRNRLQFLTGAVIIFASYALTYFGINLIQEAEMSRLHTGYYGWFAANAVLSLLAFPLVFLFERSFGFLSELSLLELADPNNPLLRELNEKAPGTFQHSLQVSNLAEDAIRLIGGQPLLVRAGAMYHDIGKMLNPQYFIENQHGGLNPHDGISFEESAAIIISHVTGGVKMAKQKNLPDAIIDFIRTHHGTNRVEYFYRMHKQSGGDVESDSKFKYPGPKPFSKETAVLMMADSVEAAGRSLKEYSSDSIDALVDKIIDSQKEGAQFDQADLTLLDISRIKKLFKKKLKGIYHVRIEYPKLETED